MTFNIHTQWAQCVYICEDTVAGLWHSAQCTQKEGKIRQGVGSNKDDVNADYGSCDKLLRYRYGQYTRAVAANTPLRRHALSTHFRARDARRTAIALCNPGAVGTMGAAYGVVLFVSYVCM